MTTADPLLAQLMADPEPGPVVDYLQERGATLPDVLLLFRGEPPDYQGGLPRAALAEWVRREWQCLLVACRPGAPAGEAGSVRLSDAVLAVPEVTPPARFASLLGPGVGALRFHGYLTPRRGDVRWWCCGATRYATYYPQFGGPDGHGVVFVLCTACGLGHFARRACCRAADRRDFKRRVLALFGEDGAPLVPPEPAV